MKRRLSLETSKQQPEERPSTDGESDKKSTRKGFHVWSWSRKHGDLFHSSKVRRGGSKLKTTLSSLSLPGPCKLVYPTLFDSAVLTFAHKFRSRLPSNSLAVPRQRRVRPKGRRFSCKGSTRCRTPSSERRSSPP